MRATPAAEKSRPGYVQEWLQTIEFELKSFDTGTKTCYVRIILALLAMAASRYRLWLDKESKKLRAC